MSNFKRKKTRRNVRCTLCTDVRWLGNNVGRTPPVVSRHRDRQKTKARMLQEIDSEI